MITTSAKSRVTVSSMPGPWAKASGIGGKTETQKVRESGGKPKVVIPGEYEANDTTVMRYFDAVRDADLLAQLSTGDFSPYAGTTITDTTFDTAGIPVGRPLVLAPCSIVSWEISDADANDEKPRELTVVWSVSR